jgi:hypothetical protein
MELQNLKKLLKNILLKNPRKQRTKQRKTTPVTKVV